MWFYVRSLRTYEDLTGKPWMFRTKVVYEGIWQRPDGEKDNFMPLCLQKTRRKALNTERTTLIYPDGGTHVGSARQAVMVFGQ